jgi:hypothetical protein
MLYYLVGSHMRTYYGASFFTENEVSWPRLKEGYQLVEKTYGTDPSRITEVGRLAATAGDKEMLSECKRRLNPGN